MAHSKNENSVLKAAKADAEKEKKDKGAEAMKTISQAEEAVSDRGWNIFLNLEKNL